MNTIRNVHNSILEKIKNGAIKQKPRWRFALMTLVIVLVFVALSFMLLYFVSFMSLVLRENLFFEALSFGPRTIFAILHTLPFLLILLVVSIFLVLHVLARHFAFAYMKPVMTTLGGGLAITLAIFAMVLVMDKNFRIARLGEGRHVPPIDMLHAHFRKGKALQLVRGTIARIDREGCDILGEEGSVTYVHVTDKTRINQASYATGTQVVVLAERVEDSLYAAGIRKIDRTFNGFSPSKR